MVRLRYMKTTFNVRWLLTHRNKTIKRECCNPFFLCLSEQFQLHFRVRKKKILPKTGLYVTDAMYSVGAYVIHLGQQLMQLTKMHGYKNEHDIYNSIVLSYLRDY